VFRGALCACGPRRGRRHLGPGPDDRHALSVARVPSGSAWAPLGRCRRAPQVRWAQWFHVHPDDAARREAATRDQKLERRTPRYEGEWRVRHQDGSYHWIQVRGSARATPRAGPFVSPALPPTSMRASRSEEALRISEERFAVAVAASTPTASGIGYITTDCDVPLRARPAYLRPEPVKTTRSREEWGSMVELHRDDIEAQRQGVRRLCRRHRAELRRRVACGACGWAVIAGYATAVYVCVTSRTAPASRPAQSATSMRASASKRNSLAAGDARARAEGGARGCIDCSSMRAREKRPLVARARSPVWPDSKQLRRQLQELAGSGASRGLALVRDERCGAPMKRATWLLNTVLFTIAAWCAGCRPKARCVRYRGQAGADDGFHAGRDGPARSGG